jgi:hypothetical protein
VKPHPSRVAKIALLDAGCRRAERFSVWQQLKTSGEVNSCRRVPQQLVDDTWVTMAIRGLTPGERIVRLSQFSFIEDAKLLL